MRTLLVALSTALVVALSLIALPESNADDGIAPYPASPGGNPPGANH